MPRSAAASIMFAVAWPKSYIRSSRCRSPSGSLATRAIVAAEEAMCLPPRSQTLPSSVSCARSVTTTKFHGCPFPADGARRPASQTRSRSSRATGWAVYWRTLRRARIASHVSMAQSYRTPVRHDRPAPRVSRGRAGRVDARSWRELLITGGLHVSHLVHGLAYPGKFGVHPPPRAVGVAQRLVLGKAVPRVVAEHVRECELPVGVESLGRKPQPGHRHVGRQALGPLDRRVLDRHEVRVGLHLDHEVEGPRSRRERPDHGIAQIILRRAGRDLRPGGLGRPERVLHRLALPQQERHVAVVLHL